jgi:hypothetical protein
MGRAAAHRITGEAHGRCRHPQHTGDRSKERGLAGSVGADDGDRLAFVRLEGHVEERLEASVEGAQVPDTQQAHCTSIPR